jgi:hypothetical protein
VDPLITILPAVDDEVTPTQQAVREPSIPDDEHGLLPLTTVGLLHPGIRSPLRDSFLLAAVGGVIAQAPCIRPSIQIDDGDPDLSATAADVAIVDLEPHVGIA